MDNTYIGYQILFKEKDGGHMLNEVHPSHHPHECPSTIPFSRQNHCTYTGIITPLLWRSLKSHLETVEIKKGEEDRVFCHRYCLTNDTQIGGGNVATIYVWYTLQNRQLF